MSRLLWFILTIMVAAGCKRQPSASPDSTRISAAYNPGSGTLHPRYGVYHDALNHSIIYGKVFPSELQFSAANPEGKLKASFEVRYSLYEISDTSTSNKPLITDTLRYEIAKEKANQRFFVNIPVVAMEGKRYLAHIVTRDQYRKSQTDNYVTLDKISHGTSQYFLAYNAADHSPLFWPFVPGNQAFSFESALVSADSFYFGYYRLPEYTRLRTGGQNMADSLPAADSVWKLPYTKSLTYSLRYEGMYVVSTDSSLTNGMVLLNSGDDYPKITRTTQMVQPIGIIALGEELTTLRSQINTKVAIDNYWLARTDNPDRSRELIRIFYNRAYIANYYFTNYQPGYQTDRGITFVLLGPPARVIRDLTTEKWIYFDEKYQQSTIYLFRNFPNKLTPENFVLQPDESIGEGLKKQLIYGEQGRF